MKSLSQGASKLLNSSWGILGQCNHAQSRAFGGLSSDSNREEQQNDKSSTLLAASSSLGLKGLSPMQLQSKGRAGLVPRALSSSLTSSLGASSLALRSPQAIQIRERHDHTWALTGMDSSSLLVLFGYGIMLSALGAGMAGLGFLIAPRKIDINKTAMYECGFDAFGDARQQFDISFYRVAILFLLFDIELAFIIPYMFSCTDWQSWTVMMFFLSILIVGFVYEWRIGALEWK